MTVRALAARWAPPAVFALLVVIGLLVRAVDAPRVGAAIVAICAALVLKRERHPAVILLATVLALVAVGVVCNGTSSNVGWFANVVLMGWVATITRWPVWLAAAGAAVAVLVFEWVSDPDPGWGPWLAGTAFATIACWLGRRQVEMAEQLRAAQAGLADRARAEERNRIARELHDALAHSLTVSLLHVTSARLAVEDDDRDEAARVLEVAERVGRAALAEVRQTVGMLRAEPHRVGGTPLPDATALAGLVETVRAAGAPVSYTESGDVAGLPATIGVVLYRILQEALTNAVRHAPGVATTVRLAVTGTQVAMCVDTAPLPAPRPPANPTDGTGLASMRERAGAVGGTCTAGRYADGWRVEVSVPIRDAGTATVQPAAEARQ